MKKTRLGTDPLNESGIDSLIRKTGGEKPLSKKHKSGSGQKQVVSVREKEHGGTKKFKYHVSFLPLPYTTSEEKPGFGGSRKSSEIPDINGFFDKYLNDEDKWNQFFASFGDEGWELTSVVPVLRGTGLYASSSKGHGYSTTEGLMFFWKKEIMR